MTYAVVTTFSPRGYEVYGRRMIETFAAFWPADVPLHVYYEGSVPVDASPRAQWRCLDDDKDRARFMAEHKGKDNDKDYRKAPVRFCHKVYALTSAPRDTDNLIFLDADCDTFAPVSHDQIEACCADPGQAGSYLGRPYSRHSETGFLSFRKNNCGYDFLDEFRRFYNDGGPLDLPEQHDSMAFDVLRRRFERLGHRFKNICQHATGLTVFPQSPLKDFISHHKGAVRKERAYGNHMIPNENRSTKELQRTVLDEVG
jgi:hypothetical protein